MNEPTAFLHPQIEMSRYVRDLFDLPPTLSSSIAHRLITRSPLHAWTAHPRLNPAWAPDDDRGFDMGTAFHAVLLEGKSLERIAAPDYRTKAAQQARDEIIKEGGVPALAWQADAIEQMVANTKAKMAASPDLIGVPVSSLRPEQTLVWHESWAGELSPDEARDGLAPGEPPVSAWCRCRPDWISEDWKVIVSVKTTGNADPETFLRGPLQSHSYDLQSAFELAGVRALTDTDAAYFYVVVEVEPPYAVSLLGLDPRFREFSASKFRGAVSTWAHCLAENHWPAYSDRICYLSLPPWMEARAMERGLVPSPGEPDVDDGRPLDVQLFGERP